MFSFEQLWTWNVNLFVGYQIDNMLNIQQQDNDNTYKGSNPQCKNKNALQIVFSAVDLTDNTLLNVLQVSVGPSAVGIFKGIVLGKGSFESFWIT